MKSTTDALLIALTYIKAIGQLEHFAQMIKDINPDTKDILEIALLAIDSKQEKENEGNLI